jgi:hypothetical protein
MGYFPPGPCGNICLKKRKNAAGPAGGVGVYKSCLECESQTDPDQTVIRRVVG